MSEMPTPADDLVVIGKIVSVYGIRGEVKVYSYRSVGQPAGLSPLDAPARRRDPAGRAGQGRLHGKVLAAKLKGLDDREEARTFTGYEICIPRSELPSLEEGEYYWHQLEGLKVIDQGGQLLGVIDHLLETGANDVMVVKPCAGSLDDRERLLPYTGQCVLSIDLAAGEMRVDWDADF